MLFGAQYQRVGLQAVFEQLLDRMLGRLGLEFAGRGHVRNQGQVHDQRVVRSQFVAELPDGFDVRQRFDVADRAADLGDDNVVYFLGAQ